MESNDITPYRKPIIRFIRTGKIIRPCCVIREKDVPHVERRFKVSLAEKLSKGKALIQIFGRERSLRIVNEDWMESTMFFGFWCPPRCPKKLFHEALRFRNLSSKKRFTNLLDWKLYETQLKHHEFQKRIQLSHNLNCVQKLSTMENFEKNISPGNPCQFPSKKYPHPKWGKIMSPGKSGPKEK